MSNLVVGYGEIGRAVGKVIGEHHHLDLNDTKMFAVDVMHICFPYSDDFVDEVKKYIHDYSPKHVAIWSTVPIGTTRSLDLDYVVHTPVEGRHPKLADSIRKMRRWIGYTNPKTATFFKNMFADLGIHSKTVASPDFTEALKLLSTTEYGVNIEFARYKKFVADSLGMDYGLTKQFNEDYNWLYVDDNRFQKFVLDAPDGPKGGHCVTPNAVLLDERFPNVMVKVVAEL